MCRQAEERVLRFTPLHVSSALRSMSIRNHRLSDTNHNTLWKVRLRNENHSRVFQDLHQQSVFLCSLKRQANISKRRVVAGNIELIFQCHAYAVQGAFGLSGLL